MFKEFFSEQFPRVICLFPIKEKLAQVIFLTLCQPPLAMDHLCGRHMYLIQPTTMSVFHVNSQKPMQ